MNINNLIQKVENTKISRQFGVMFYTDNEKTETMQKLNEYSALLSDIPSSPEDFCDLMEVKYGAMTDNPIHDEKDIGLRQMDLYQFAKSMADRC